MASSIDCRYVEESELANSYLAGKLSEGEAEAFERHYLACDRCRSELKTLSELRAALGKPPVVPMESRSNPHTSWWPLAAAATVAIAALGVWQLTRRAGETQTAPVMRGQADDSLKLKVGTDSQGTITISWSRHPAAQRYVVQVLRSDGMPVLKSETRDTSVRLERSALLQPTAGNSFSVRVRALGPTGAAVAESESLLP